MKFNIVSDNSGDTIPFDSTNDKVLEYYLDLLNKRKINSFSQTNVLFGQELTQTIKNLDSVIVQSNTWLSELINKTIDVFEYDDYLNQNNLNKLHAEWVNSHKLMCATHIDYTDSNLHKLHDLFPDDIQQASLSSILSKLNLLKQYSELNVNVHKIESMFENIDFSVTELSWIQFDNPFSGDILSHNRNNFQLTFNHLGRLLYNKYQTFDDHLEHKDENSFNQLLGFVSLNLNRPETFAPSQEYSDWCLARNRAPIGKFLNLGNIRDLEKKLHDYRLVVYRNLSKNNNFSIDA